MRGMEMWMRGMENWRVVTCPVALFAVATRAVAAGTRAWKNASGGERRGTTSARHIKTKPSLQKREQIVGCPAPVVTHFFVFDEVTIAAMIPLRNLCLGLLITAATGSPISPKWSTDQSCNTTSYKPANQWQCNGLSHVKTANNADACAGNAHQVPHIMNAQRHCTIKH